jgi:hypothetical protein
MKGIGGHHSAKGATDEWLTPPDLLSTIGGADSFDLDPCAPIVRPWPTAREHYTVNDNGLMLPFHGRVFCNPPYTEPYLSWFLERMQMHNNGLGLVFARTETEWFFRYVWRGATALTFIEGRIHFHYGVDTYDKKTGELLGRVGDRAKHNAGGPSVLVAYGAEEAERLGDLPRELGQFQPLLVPRSYAVAAIGTTWSDLVASLMRGRGPVPLAELYRAVAAYSKAQGRPHYREQVRKVLQQGPFQRVSAGVWVSA